MQQGVQGDSTSNLQQCWELLANKVACVCSRGFTLPCKHSYGLVTFPTNTRGEAACDETRNYRSSPVLSLVDAGNARIARVRRNTRSVTEGMRRLRDDGEQVRTLKELLHKSYIWVLFSYAHTDLQAAINSWWTNAVTCNLLFTKGLHDTSCS